MRPLRRARAITLHAGLVQTRDRRRWLLFAFIAAIDWALLAIHAQTPIAGWEWPMALIDATGAGWFTGVCCGPLILRVRGRR